jgi:hypothetical protein
MTSGRGKEQEAGCNARRPRRRRRAAAGVCSRAHRRPRGIRRASSSLEHCSGYPRKPLDCAVGAPAALRARRPEFFICCGATSRATKTPRRPGESGGRSVLAHFVGRAGETKPVRFANPSDRAAMFTPSLVDTGSSIEAPRSRACSRLLAGYSFAAPLPFTPVHAGSSPFKNRLASVLCTPVNQRERP